MALGCSRELCERAESFMKRLVPFILLIIYTFFGGFLFHMVEEPFEIQNDEEVVEDLRRLREQTAGQLRVILQDARWDSQKLQQTLMALEVMQKNAGLETTADDNPSWNFWNSQFYAFTLYTTIGYGHLVPLTRTGQACTVIYSIFGIPLALITLVELGALFAQLVEAIYSVVHKLCQSLKHRRWQRVLQGTGEEEKADLLNFPLSSLVVLTVGYVFAIAGILLLWEDWDYWTSFYFCFISFSTIGLGDITPQHPKFTLLISILLLLGLALVSTCLTLLQKQFEALMKRTQDDIENQYQAAQVDAEYDVSMADDDEGIDSGIQRMVYQMPGGSRFLFKLLPDARKAKLRSAWKKRAAMRVKCTQTEDYLARTVRMGRIGESQRSHDDINSLVAMCDFALR